MAETASVFGEMLVFDRLRRQEQPPRARLALLCAFIEEAFGTVFRQIALTRFEQGLHDARRARGRAVERAHRRRSGTTVNAALYGDSVVLTDDYRWWWAYIPHFIHSPFYCYAYGFGELLVLALYELYREQGAAFVPQYLELLAAGGSDAPATAAPARRRHPPARVLAARPGRAAATGGGGESAGGRSSNSTRPRDAEGAQRLSSGSRAFAPSR